MSNADLVAALRTVDEWYRALATSTDGPEPPLPFGLGSSWFHQARKALVQATREGL
jgi:hypothetical protein